MDENPEAPVPLTMNTGVMILEPDILEYIDEDDDDESLLGGAIRRALKDRKRFVEYKWPHWSHVMHLIDLRTLHKKRLKILQSGGPAGVEIRGMASLSP